MFSRGYLLGIGIGSIIMIIATWLGYSIDAKGYLTNIFTEITSIVVTIFLVSLIIDRYHKFQRQKHSTSEGKKMPKKHAPTGGKLQKPLGKKISYSQ